MTLNLINLGKMPKTVGPIGCHPGSRKKTVFKYVYDEKHGCPRRVENGQVDVQDLIQAYADDIDFKAIGKMLVDTRDNVKSHFDLNGEIMDMTGLPRNIHEYEALHNKMKAEFEKLPTDQKALFNDSFDNFRTAWSGGTLETILKAYEASKTVKTEDVASTEGGAE